MSKRSDKIYKNIKVIFKIMKNWLRRLNWGFKLSKNKFLKLNEGLLIQIEFLNQNQSEFEIHKFNGKLPNSTVRHINNIILIFKIIYTISNIFS